MIKSDEILEQYLSKEEIKQISSIIKNKKIIKTDHFYQRIFGRDLPEELVDRTLYDFEKIKLINKRRHKKGDIGYDFYYELSNSRTLILGFIFLKNKILLVNAILRHRTWQNSIRLTGTRRGFR